MSWTTHFGLDVGSLNIKLVQLEPSGSKYRLLAIGQTPRPDNLSLSAASADVAPLVEVIKNLIKVARPSSRNVVVGLPESQVYTRIIQMPQMNEVELTAAIKFQIEQYVPLPADQIIEKHSVISSPTGPEAGMKSQMQVLLVAAPIYLVDRYMQVMKMAGLEVIGVDTEILATSRVLFTTKNFAGATLVVHIGGTGTDLALIKNNELFATRTVPTGSVALTRAIASELNVDFSQAENYKKTMGMDENQLSGNVRKAVQPVVDLIVTEIKRVLAAPESSGPNETVRRVVVSGGGSSLPGLVSYLASQLNMEVELANPFSDITKSSEQTTYIGQNASAFTTAAGLALKEI